MPQIEIPFDLMEAMIAAANKSIFSGGTTHETVCAVINAANKEGWVLQRKMFAKNQGVDLHQPNRGLHMLVKAYDDDATQ